MIKKNIVNKLLESNKIIVGNDIPKGIKMNFMNNEIILTGDQKSLLELADYIISVALSEEAKDHLHLDKNTLIENASNIENLIIEKE